jgi:hypothetical protein
MASYTMGTREMIGAMIQALPEHYEMSLNRSDMRALIFALASGAGFIDVGADCTCPKNRSFQAEHSGYCRYDPNDTINRAVSLFSGVAETLGIEGI